MAFRFPPNLKHEDISSIESKPKNKVFQFTVEEEGNVKRYKSKKLVHNTSLVGAQFQADGLHLTPINSSHEFKYCLDHLNAASKQKILNDGVKQIDIPEPVKVSAVTMRFAAVDEEEKRRIREGTFNHHREVLGKEKPIQLAYLKLPDKEVGKAAIKTEVMET